MNIEWKRVGQPRAYADTERVGVARFDEPVDREAAFEAVLDKIGYRERPFPMAQKKEFGPCFDPWCDYFRSAGAGCWEFRFVEAYTG